MFNQTFLIPVRFWLGALFAGENVNWIKPARGLVALDIKRTIRTVGTPLKSTEVQFGGRASCIHLVVGRIVLGFLFHSVEDFMAQIASMRDENVVATRHVHL